MSAVCHPRHRRPSSGTNYESFWDRFRQCWMITDRGSLNGHHLVNVDMLR
jgi:hypothetical protein